MRPLSLLAYVLVLTSFADAYAQAPKGLFELGQYMTTGEFRAHHPRSDHPIYHGSAHSLRVAHVAQRYALARKLHTEQAKFLSEVALVHDWDPRREPGTPASVQRTLKLLRDDFAGKSPMIVGHNGSVLKKRFNWGPRQLKMALAMIQRTEFPFGREHPSSDYAKTSPRDRYKQMLSGLERQDQHFVIREAAILSEYADKASGYMTQDFDGAMKTVEGLANELNTAAKKKVISVAELGTHKFLASIGQTSSFTHDYQIAKELKLRRMSIPRLGHFVARMPASYKRTFKANLNGFGAYDRALKRGRDGEHALALGKGAYQTYVSSAAKQDSPRFKAKPRRARGFLPSMARARR